MFRFLIQPNAGLFFTIDDESGKVAFCVPFAARPGAGVDARYGASTYKGSVKELSTNLNKLDPRIRNAFIKWSKSISAERLNVLINA